MTVLRYLILVCIVLAPMKQAFSAQGDAATAQAGQSAIDESLAIIRDVLLTNDDPSKRVSAAGALLFHENPTAQELVLEALGRADNPAARAAVCEALDQSRTDSRELKARERFLQPLVKVLGSEEDRNIARLAAQATLMFTYEQVGSELEGIADNVELSSAIRLQAVYALQLQPYAKAARKLMTLANSSDVAVAQAAGNALAALKISVSGGAEELDEQGEADYLRMRLVHSEADIRGLKSDLAAWQRNYFGALRAWYDSIEDEAARSSFLAKRLKSPEDATKLWALDRLEELKQGTSKPKLSDGDEKTLLALVSHANSQVRLKTARLLAKMWELNSAEVLRKQLEAEKDGNVRRELFVALGSACYYASLPSSKLKVPDEVRRATLKWADEFLRDDDAETARRGADVIRKLLEQDGLEPEETVKYIEALAKRCRDATEKTSPELRGELLNAMARLCAEPSTCKVQARKSYKLLFEESLGDEAEVVRQAAAEGLINRNKGEALVKFREVLLDDRSAAIRTKVIDLAGEVGQAKDDLPWLWNINGAGGNGPAWQAMLKIFGRSDAEVMATWITIFDEAATEKKLSLEKRISFLTLFEQKAQGQNKPDRLKQAREELLLAYAATNNAPQTLEYFKLLTDADQAKPVADSFWAKLLSVCLSRANVELAGKIVQKCLETKDLNQDDPVVRSIEGYLSKPPPDADPNGLRETLQKIDLTEAVNRPIWEKLRKRWVPALAQAQRPEDAKQANN